MVTHDSSTWFLFKYHVRKKYSFQFYTRCTQYGTPRGPSFLVARAVLLFPDSHVPGAHLHAVRPQQQPQRQQAQLLVADHPQGAATVVFHVLQRPLQRKNRKGNRLAYVRSSPRVWHVTLTTCNSVTVSWKVVNGTPLDAAAAIDVANVGGAEPT